MNVVFLVEPSTPSTARDAVEAAAAAAQAGGLVVFPTDTVYGIACRPDDPAATRRLFHAKRRPHGLNLPVLAPSPGEALDLVVPTEASRRLAAAFWPGPLTMVLPRSERSRPWALGQAVDTVGVRVPDHPLSLELLRRAGPLAATSANISAEPEPGDEAGLRAAFGDGVAVYIVSQGPARRVSGRSSTVVDLSGPEPRVIREGPIEASAVFEVTRRGRGSPGDPHSVH